jgi:hypothetical protein
MHIDPTLTYRTHRSINQEWTHYTRKLNGCTLIFRVVHCNKFPLGHVQCLEAVLVPVYVVVHTCVTEQ